jgi:hypothetical protein
MVTIDPQRALAEYQRRVGQMANDVIMRDVAIAELEEQVAQLRDQLDQVRPPAPE